MDYIKYKRIKDYEDYIIFTTGKVYSTISNKFMKSPINGSGYNVIQLFNNHNYKYFMIHQLVGIMFIPNPTTKPTIDHIDRNKNNNNLYNLRWATRTEQNLNRKINSHNQTGITGVCYDKKRKSYRAQFTINKKTTEKTFSIKKYGDEAFKLAIEWRNKHAIY